MNTTKPRKVMSPEQLEKLKFARIKALEVRQRNSQKMKDINELEKKALEVQHHNKIETLKAQVNQQVKNIVQPKEETIEVIPQIKQPKEKLTKHNKLKNIIEAESDSSNSDEESDKEDLIKDYLKTKYKQKYKNKYESRTLTQLTKGLANNHVKTRLNDEMIALCSKNLFG
jgi:hypothetical protein